MEITEVRVALREGPARSPGPPSTHVMAGERRLKAYATLTFDHCFVVRNVKIIEGKSGLFVAMPSHKPKVACTRCQYKNDFGGRYCSQCGSALARLPERAPYPAGTGRQAGEMADNPAHRDIAHPITMEFRQYLQQTVLAGYEAELAKTRSGHPSDVAAGEAAL
jgi:stage V sporulation protein G